LNEKERRTVMKQLKFSETIFLVSLAILFYFAIPGILANAIGFDSTTGWLIGLGGLVRDLSR